MAKYPYSFHIALDGSGLNGIEGYAGICRFEYDPQGNRHDFQVRFFNGAAAGHCPSINPSRKVGFLGNFAQHLLFYDAQTLQEIDRISTLKFEDNDTTIRGSTHVIWTGEREFITVIGDYFYRFDLDRLSKPQKLGPHLVKLPHAMKITKSGRYICYGSIDHPKRGEAREVGVLDVKTGKATRIDLPATCWHLAVHPTKDLFYPVTYRVLPQENNDYHQWAPAFFKEYAFEVDAAKKRVTRHWSGSRELPAHLNSDVAVSDSELIFCASGSHAIVLIDLNNFSDYRILEQKPGGLSLLTCGRQVLNDIYEGLARGSFFSANHHVLSIIRISRFTCLDGIYATQLSRDQKLLFTANRGQNRIVIYDYPSLKERLNVKMPDFQRFFPKTAWYVDPRLGFHHGYLISA